MPEILSEEAVFLSGSEPLRGKHRKGFGRYLATGKRKLNWARIEVPARHKDSREFPLEISFGEYNQDGTRFFIGVARDISEQKYSKEALEKANAEIRESEMQFRTLANAIPQLCWMAHNDGSVFWFNDRWVEYTGKAFDQDKESTWQTVHDPATLQEMMVRWKTSVPWICPFWKLPSRETTPLGWYRVYAPCGTPCS